MATTIIIMKICNKLTTIKHLRLSLLLRLYDYQKSAYDYGRSTTMRGLRLWRAYDYDTNRHKFRCKFIIKLYQKNIKKKLRKKSKIKK